MKKNCRNCAYSICFTQSFLVGLRCVLVNQTPAWSNGRRGICATATKSQREHQENDDRCSKYGHLCTKFVSDVEWEIAKQMNKEGTYKQAVNQE